METKSGRYEDRCSNLYRREANTPPFFVGHEIRIFYANRKLVSILMPLPIETILCVVRDHQKFVLTTHVNPDGDGLGSEMALEEGLALLGKQATILNHSKTPDNYLFLDPQGRIRVFEPARDADTVTAADVIIVIDTNHPDRLRSLEQFVLKSRAVKIVIDHHLDPAPFAQHYLVDEEATSTGELIYRLLLLLCKGTISPSMARSLYCAIMTDTGSFRYSHVDPEIHRIVAHLIESGADPGEIYRNIYEQWTPGRIQLLGETLASLRTEFDGRLAHISVTREMLKRTGTMEADTDNFTAYPMNVAGVVAGILFLELTDGVKMSLRSRGEIPINELAKEFAGNGHRNAAGARLYNMTMEELKPRVLAAARKYLPTERMQ